jgi:hypothetical protein
MAVDEVTALITILSDNWAAACTALDTTNGNGSILDIHAVTPQILDIRNMNSGKNVDAQGRSRGGNRINMSKIESGDRTAGTPEPIYSNDLIIISQTSQTVNYPTVFWDSRDEEHSMDIWIRTRQDDRTLTNGNKVSPNTGTFGIDRIRSLYIIVRYIIEQKRKGYIKDGALYEGINHLILGGRTESNDKRNKLFGYKINITMRKLAKAVS